MRYIAPVLVLLFIQNTRAQFARVIDPDGCVNLREEPQAEAKIIDKIAQYELVYILDNEETSNQWLNVIYNPKEKPEVSGFIYGNRLEKITHLPKVRFTKSVQGVMFFNDPEQKIQVEIARVLFDAEKEISSFKRKEGHYESYRNKVMWGTDGNLPNSRYQYIRATINGTRVEVPQKVLENLFEPTLITKSEEEKYVGVYYDARLDTLYVLSTNSDGAGAYVVVFVFQNGHFSKAIPVIPF